MQQFHYLKLKIGNKHRNCRMPCSILSTNEHMAKLTQRTLTHGYVDTNNSNYRMVNAPMRGEDSYLSCDNIYDRETIKCLIKKRTIDTLDK